MTVSETVDLTNIPVLALRPATREKIYNMMNFNSVIPSPAGLPRDWRGLAQLLNIKPPCGSMANPTEHILKQFEKLPNSNLKILQDAFGELDRWDVFDDTESMFQNDGKNYSQIIERSSGNIYSPHIDFLTDEIVTYDDLHRAGQHLPPLTYDAFVLFAQENEGFAIEVITKLEEDYSAKVCCKDRDFIPGLQLEHISVMKMLMERCHRLVVIISNDFIRSDFNKYFLNFASAVSIEQRRMKIIPIVLEYCPDLPMVVKYCHLLDFTRSSRLWNFWEKLGTAVAQSRRSSDSVGAVTDCPTRLMLKDVKERQSVEEKNASQGDNYPQYAGSTCKLSEEHLEKELQAVSIDKKKDKSGKIMKLSTGVFRRFAKNNFSKKGKKLACSSD